ncbi:hypothetical protein L208DRAFT_1388483 [Tricholoma matsutake]|nr:hypothetical protein L208DRAFT_1388483 [Tricholoma matsutake 945]
MTHFVVRDYSSSIFFFFLVERLSTKLRSTPTTDKVSMGGRVKLGKSLLKTRKYHLGEIPLRTLPCASSVGLAISKIIG